MTAEEHQSGPYLLFTLGLSIFALGSLAVDSVLHLDPRVHSVLEYADTAVCALFFIDFVVTLYRAPNRKRYLLQWGWLDLLSSIPTVNVLRIGRAARVVRILRVLRALRSARILARALMHRRAEGSSLAVILVVLLLIVVGSISVLQFESVPEGNIKSAEDALWWSVTTITTVGYGDRFPVTSEGRFVAVILMFAGVGLFGTVSGLVASWMLRPTDGHHTDELSLLRQEVRELKELLQQDRSRPG